VPSPAAGTVAGCDTPCRLCRRRVKLWRDTGGQPASCVVTHWSTALTEGNHSNGRPLQLLLWVIKRIPHPGACDGAAPWSWRLRRRRTLVLAAISALTVGGLVAPVGLAGPTPLEPAGRTRAGVHRHLGGPEERRRHDHQRPAVASLGAVKVDLVVRGTD